MRQGSEYVRPLGRRQMGADSLLRPPGGAAERSDAFVHLLGTNPTPHSECNFPPSLLFFPHTDSSRLRVGFLADNAVHWQLMPVHRSPMQWGPNTLSSPESDHFRLGQKYPAFYLINRWCSRAARRVHSPLGAEPTCPLIKQTIFPSACLNNCLPFNAYRLSG